jgi:hypothetical protein
MPLIGMHADGPQLALEGVVCGAIDDVIFLLKSPWLIVTWGSHNRLLNVAPVVGGIAHDPMNVCH